MRLADIEWQELDLMPENTVLQDPPELRGVISVGSPWVFDAISYAEKSRIKLDPAVHLLLQKNRFFLVRLPISLRPTDKLSVRFLSVDTALESPGQRAVCFSMLPERVEQEIKVTAESELSSTLKLSIGDVGAEIGASDSGQAEYVVYQPNITAFNIGRPDPAWEFDPVEGRVLRGVQLLHLVVQAPKGVGCTGTVRIRADIVASGLLWNTVAVDRRNSHRVQEFDLSMRPA
jgi:hypothetical protein